MRSWVVLVAALLLAGCTYSSSSSSRSTTRSTETLYEGTLGLGPEPRASATGTVEVPANTSEIRIQADAERAVNLQVSGPGCGTENPGNVQVAVSGSQSVQVLCKRPPAGPFTFTVSRDAGSGPVSVVVTGTVTRVSST